MHVLKRIPTPPPCFAVRFFFPPPEFLGSREGVGTGMELLTGAFKITQFHPALNQGNLVLK